MIKYLKHILIVSTIILSILLVINIYKYINKTNKNNYLIDNTNNYELKINENNIKIKNIEIEIKNLQEEKKEKIQEYEKWLKWNEEIIAKIN